MTAFFSWSKAETALEHKRRSCLFTLFLLSTLTTCQGQIIEEVYSLKNAETKNFFVWKNLPKKSLDSAKLWVKLTLHVESDESVLVLKGFYDSVKLCKSKDCGTALNYKPLLSRLYQATPQTLTIPLQTSFKKDTTILLQLTGVPSKPDISLFPESKFMYLKEREIFLSALFCGLILAVIIFTLYYFINENKLLYRCYALYVTFLLLSSIIHLDTLVVTVLNVLRSVTNQPDKHYLLFVKFLNLTALLTALRFGYIFFNDKKTPVTINRIFKVHTGIILLAYLFIFLTPIYSHLYVVFSIVILTFLLLIAVSGYLWFTLRKKSYLIYHVAYILFFIGYLFNIYSNVTKSNYTPTFFIGGVLIETLLLSYALVTIISEEKQQAKFNLIKTTEELYKRISEFERFSNVLAHNLRAPIARLLGLANLTVKISPDQVPELMTLIGKVANDLDMTVKKIRQILEVKKEEITLFEPVNLKEIIKELRPKIDKKISETNAELMVNLTGDEVIMGNRKYVSDILCNILENSFKFREPTRKLKVELASKTEKNELLIIIKDNGSGFPLDRVSDKIFEPFQRFHNNVEGKGVGLYLTKILVEKLKGEIHIDSIPHRGTDVILKFPKISKTKRSVVPDTFTIPDFAEAKEKHLEWMYLIKKLLNGEQDAISLDAAISHFQCELGKWFYSEGKAKFGHLKQIRDFEREHILLHSLTKDIIINVKEGNIQLANEQFEKLKATSQKLLNMLSEIEEILYSQL